MDRVRQAIQGELGRSPTAAQRRAMQALLLQLAEEQERLATAQERLIKWRVASQIEREAKPLGRPAGRGGSFVRFELRPATYVKGGHWLHISSLAYRLLEQPDRIAFRLLDNGAIWMYAVAPSGSNAPIGYAVSRNKGIRGGNPRISIGMSQATALGLVVGRMPVEVDDDGRVLILPTNTEEDPHGG